MYLYIPVTCFFASEPCVVGFRGVLCDANMLVPDVQQPPADPDIDRGDPCQKDEEFFDRLDASSCSHHGRLGCLPVPTVKYIHSMCKYVPVIYQYI